MIIPMLCVTIFVILVVWFLLPRVARLMIHTPTAISIFVCLSMVQDRKSGSAGMPRPISYAVFCLKKKNNIYILFFLLFYLMILLPLISTLFPYTTLFRSTLADDRLEAFYDNPNALRDYFRDIGRMVLAAEGRKANDSHADCYQYFCVPEYGTANGRLHFHAVHFMRTLPTGS